MGRRIEAGGDRADRFWVNDSRHLGPLGSGCFFVSISVALKWGRGRNPVGVGVFFRFAPRVVAARQPWAGGRGPVGADFGKMNRGPAGVGCGFGSGFLEGDSEEDAFAVVVECPGDGEENHVLVVGSEADSVDGLVAVGGEVVVPGFEG